MYYVDTRNSNFYKQYISSPHKGCYHLAVLQGFLHSVQKAIKEGQKQKEVVTKIRK
jgi:hypothetical protein